MTDTPAGSMHYHPASSPDDRWLLYGWKRDGVRQLYVMRLVGPRSASFRLNFSWRRPMID